MELKDQAAPIHRGQVVATAAKPWARGAKLDLCHTGAGYTAPARRAMRRLGIRACKIDFSGKRVDYSR